MNPTNETRPDNVAPQNWKNRHMVGVKLTHINHKKFRDWCKKNNYSYSSGINYLISNYLPEKNV